MGTALSTKRSQNDTYHPKVHLLALLDHVHPESHHLLMIVLFDCKLLEKYHVIIKYLTIGIILKEFELRVLDHS